MITPVSYKITNNSHNGILENKSQAIRYVSANKNDQVSFTGIKNIKRINLSEYYPLHYYLNKIFNKLRKISKARRAPISEELQGKITSVMLSPKKGTEFEILDINPLNKKKKYAIFYHGLSQNTMTNQPLYETLLKKGYGVLAVEYGNFGKSRGSKINQNAIIENTEAALDYLKSKGIRYKKNL